MASSIVNDPFWRDLRHYEFLADERRKKRFALAVHISSHRYAVKRARFKAVKEERESSPVHFDFRDGICPNCRSLTSAHKIVADWSLVTCLDCLRHNECLKRRLEAPPLIYPCTCPDPNGCKGHYPQPEE